MQVSNHFQKLDSLCDLSIQLAKRSNDLVYYSRIVQYFSKNYFSFRKTNDLEKVKNIIVNYSNNLVLTRAIDNLSKLYAVNIRSIVKNL